MDAKGMHIKLMNKEIEGLSWEVLDMEKVLACRHAWRKPWGCHSEVAKATHTYVCFPLLI